MAGTCTIDVWPKQGNKPLSSEPPLSGNSQRSQHRQRESLQGKIFAGRFGPGEMGPAEEEELQHRSP
jgi:hypothetical protein